MNGTPTTPDPSAAQLLRACAQGRRDYAQNAPEDTRRVLEIEANAYDNAARLVDGDLTVAYGLLPSRSWHAAGLPEPDDGTFDPHA